MRSILPGIFSLLVAAAGWYYLFYSRAALRLGGIESADINARRVRLRRIGGGLMVLLGAAFFIGFYSVDWEMPTSAFMAAWLAVLVLLGAIVVLALIDMRLTLKMRRRRDEQR